MRVCVVGAGVIGTTYGHAPSESGHEVVHFVRAGHGERLRDGLLINLLDARPGDPAITPTVSATVGSWLRKSWSK
jgi:ketopantoate reductase